VCENQIACSPTAAVAVGLFYLEKHLLKRIRKGVKGNRDGGKVNGSDTMTPNLT